MFMNDLRMIILNKIAYNDHKNVCPGQKPFLLSGYDHKYKYIAEYKPDRRTAVYTTACYKGNRHDHTYKNHCHYRCTQLYFIIVKCNKRYEAKHYKCNAHGNDIYSAFTDNDTDDHNDKQSCQSNKRKQYHHSFLRIFILIKKT